MGALRGMLLLNIATCWVAAAPKRVLFVGNSFTFVNDLPHQLVNIAQSLGKEVVVANSTIGGCTVYYQRAETDTRTAELLQEDWDYIVLQSYSNLPTVQKARETYLTPAVRSFAAKKKKAKIVMYLTWGYHSGNVPPPCPSGSGKCFPLGTNAELTSPLCNQSRSYQYKVDSFPCMGYAIARGYYDQLSQGADMIAPCGLAWQVSRGVTGIPANCKAAIDEEYGPANPSPFVGNLTLPLKVAGLPTALSQLELYRILHDAPEPHGANFDKHPNQAGQYLNALVFFATLFGASPIGAAGPLHSGKAPALPLQPSILQGLQKLAHSVVLDHAEAWGVTPTSPAALDESAY